MICRYRYRHLSWAFIFAICTLRGDAWSQEPAATPPEAASEPSVETGQDAVTESNSDSGASQRAKEVFEASFEKYKDSLREIEKLRTQYQTAGATERKRLNEQLTGHVANAQSLVNELVDATMEAYRTAPNSDPRVTELLASVAEYYVTGRDAAGPTQPIVGGGQYEQALPILNLLSEGQADNPELPVWGFLAAFMGNDYPLAEQFLKTAVETGAFQKAKDHQSKSRARTDALDLAMNYAHAFNHYREMWQSEAEIRDAEASADDLPRVKLTTTKGAITLELFENEAPQSVANFLTLVKQGFYDGSPFHRVIENFMAQGGAKGDDGSGGPGYTIPCECYEPDARMHFRGSLSMAHRGKDTGSSQFFLTTVPTGHLDGKHTVFGRIIDGIEVLGDITRRQPTGNPSQDEALPEPDRIIKAEILRDRGHTYEFEKLPE